MSLQSSVPEKTKLSLLYWGLNMRMQVRQAPCRLHYYKIGAIRQNSAGIHRTLMRDSRVRIVEMVSG